jgi:uncharacterized protein YecE (DUF72 family)
VLERYARVFPCVEINTSFYRPHRRTTYERWAASTPDAFRFAVKAPRTVTHERRLQDPDEPLARFFDEIAGLGEKLGPVLVQLPPSLAFDAAAAEFLDGWRDRYAGPTVLEPRHRSWFAPEVEAQLAAARIARVAADPAVVPDAARPGGWRGLTYLRLHGSPKMYDSAYDDAALAAAAAALAERPAGTEAWCVFDNTRLGAAAPDALRLTERLRPRRSRAAGPQPAAAAPS